MPVKAQASYIVVADDDEGIRTLTSQLLQANGYLVCACSDGSSALKLAADLDPAAVILDVRMSDLSGLEVCRQLRSQSDVPIIMLTVLGDESDAVRAFDAGADDYIRKPFGARELVSRVNAAVKRHRQGDYTLPVAVGSLEVDERQHVARLGSTELRLSRTQFALLSYLARHAGQVVTHAQILDQVWGYEYGESLQPIRIAVHRLRQKLAAAEDIELETMSGVGYRLRFLDPVRRVARRSSE